MTPSMIRAAAILMAALLSATAAFAEDSHCESGVGERNPSTPDSEFELPRDGTVIHTPTRLQWGQCALGQSWSRDFCTGSATSVTWEEARAAIDAINQSGELAGYTDWRLPTLTELESIVDKCRAAPAINDTIFPNTPWAGFWSSTPYEGEEGHVWFVGFYYGLSLEYHQDASYRVRPVRSRPR